MFYEQFDCFLNLFLFCGNDEKVDIIVVGDLGFWMMTKLSFCDTYPALIVLRVRIAENEQFMCFPVNPCIAVRCPVFVTVVCSQRRTVTLSLS